MLLTTLFVGAPAWRNRHALHRSLFELAVLGFLAMCLFQSLSYLAAQSTSGTNMAVFTALVPLLINVAMDSGYTSQSALRNGWLYSADLTKKVSEKVKGFPTPKNDDALRALAQADAHKPIQRQAGLACRSPSRTRPSRRRRVRLGRRSSRCGTPGPAPRLEPGQGDLTAATVMACATGPGRPSRCWARPR